MEEQIAVTTTMRKRIVACKVLVVAFVSICAIFLTVCIIGFCEFLLTSFMTAFEYSYVSVQMAVEGFQPDNEVLLRYVRDNFLVPPSTKPYNMSTKLIDTSMGQSQVVFEILNHKRNGFFVECGALDGETRSNTYWFERELGWRGILIEADPKNFNLLLSKNRKAYAVPACLSSFSHSMPFYPHFNIGKISDGTKKGLISVQCLTLWTVILALNKTKTIDYLSLDVEGHELEVLRTIPFHLLNIRAMSVEWKHVAEGKDFVREYVESKGYVMVKEVTAVNNLANDFIFLKK